MPTNEERREIAKAIRKTAQQSFLGTRFFTPHSIERLLNLEVEGTFLGIDYYTVGSVLRLADLIEPEPERTGHAVEDVSIGGYVSWRCSECGQPINKADNYCSYCGAEVVQDAN